MEDAIGIQETGWEQRPARMVGLSDLDSAKVSRKLALLTPSILRRGGEDVQG